MKVQNKLWVFGEDYKGSTYTLFYMNLISAFRNVSGFINCIFDIRIRTHQLIQERLFGWSILTFKILDSKFMETRSNGFYFVFIHLRLAAKRIQTPKDSSGFEKSSLVET